MARKSCTVVFFPARRPGLGPSAVATDGRGRSFNVINYPVGYKLTAKEKARARRVLCPGKKSRRT